MKSGADGGPGGDTSGSSSSGGDYSGLIAADVPELTRNSKAFGETGTVVDGLLGNVDDVEDVVSRNTTSSDAISQQIKGYVPPSLGQAKQLLLLLQAIIGGNAEKAQAISDALAQADSDTTAATSGGNASGAAAGGHSG